jgi:ABC-2 type transport system permease protein
MKNLLNIIKKNLRLLIRSKTSALIVVLGPLLIILLAGLAFDNVNTYRLTLGAYSGSYNNLSDSFIYSLARNEFKVLKYPSLDDCVGDVKQGVIHSCLVFSDDFELGNNMKNEISFYVDPSKVNLIGTLLETMSKRVSLRKGELSLNLTEVLVDNLNKIGNLVGQERVTLIELTTQNDEAAQTIEQTAKVVNRMNFNLTLTDAEIMNMSNTLDNLSAAVSGMEGIANDSIGEAYEYISNVDDLVESSSLSAEEKASITSSLVTALNNLDDLEGELNSTSFNSSRDLNSLQSITKTVVDSLNSTRENLILAKRDRAMAIVNFQAIDESLNQSLARILKLQNAFNQIDHSIKGIKVTEPGTIVNPVTTTINPVASETSYLNYIFPSLIILIIMFTGILLPSTLIQIEKNSKAFFRNFMAPVSDIVHIIATLATSFLLLAVQVIIVLLIAMIFFSQQVFSGILGTILVLLFSIAVFVSLGMLIGYVFKSEETTLLASISVSSIMLLISDLILPIESMPSYIAFLAEYNPFVICSSLLKKTMLFNLSVGSISGDLFFLLGYGILFFALVFLVEVVSKKQGVKRYIDTIMPQIKAKIRRKPRKKQ